MIAIDYNHKSGRFIIKSPPWEVDRMRALPNRRWDPKNKVWTAPAIRANIEYIKAMMRDASLSEKAIEAINKSSERLNNNKLRNNGFLSIYGFKTKPYDHQKEALNKLYGSATAALCMEMGTGKTKVFIDMHCAYNIEGKVNAVVVVCPKSIRRTWIKELNAHATVDYSAHILDTSKKQAFDKWVSSSHPFKWLIVSTQSLATGSAASMVERFLLTTVNASMIIDESHLIKTHNAKRAIECVRLGKMAERRYIGTGTFIANSPMDAFMQFEFLDPDIIGVGDYYSFRNRYAIMGGFEGKQIIGYQNMDELIELISPFIYECKKSDVLDLPPKVYETREIELPDELMKMYKNLAVKKYVETNDGVMTVQTVLEKMLRLQELTSGIISYENPEGSTTKYRKEVINKWIHPKVQEILDIAESTDESIIVWCVYRPEIEMVVSALRDKYGHDQVVELHGGIDEEERHHNVENVFQKKKARFLVGNASTGGVGLTITAATVVIYFSNSFNFVDRVQSEDRAHRSGQTKSVTIIDLIAKGTVDEIVYEALNNKQDVSDYIKTKISETIKRISIA